MKKDLIKDLKKVMDYEREEYDFEVHSIHKKHDISKKTLLYIKEYSEDSHSARKIIRESLKILLLASIISSLGGLALDRIEMVFLSLTPLIVLFPILNNMVGNYGTVISSRFSTMLHENKVKDKWWKTKELRKLFLQIFILTLLGVFLSSAAAIIITYFSPEGISIEIATKVFLIVLIDMIILGNILFFIAIYAGIYYYKKKEDPDNFLIPITTAIADFSNMVILAILVVVLF